MNKTDWFNVARGTVVNLHLNGPECWVWVDKIGILRKVYPWTNQNNISQDLKDSVNKHRRDDIEQIMEIFRYDLLRPDPALNAIIEIALLDQLLIDSVNGPIIEVNHGDEIQFWDAEHCFCPV